MIFTELLLEQIGEFFKIILQTY